MRKSMKGLEGKMIDFIKELAWAIAHDADTKIILSIIISFIAMVISVALLVAHVSGR